MNVAQGWKAPEPLWPIALKRVCGIEPNNCRLCLSAVCQKCPPGLLTGKLPALKRHAPACPVSHGGNLHPIALASPSLLQRIVLQQDIARRL